MTIHLTPELENMVQTLVQSGRYGSANGVVRDALRLLVDHDEFRELRKRDLQQKVAQGLASLDRGEGLDGGEFFAQLEREEAGLDHSRT